MTRKEQIKEIAQKEMSKYPNFCITAPAFRMGAEWADAHPDIDVRTSGYKEAIDKACEWLNENMNDVGIRFMRGDEIKDIVDLFRKAMKGGRG